VPSNGLVTKRHPVSQVVTSCDEICGDNISYKKSLKLKSLSPSLIGGVPFSTRFECDDGNIKDGDGCSGNCTIESGFSCLTSDDTGSLGKCVSITKIELT
jgi:cysteine-rich repeat protein